MRKRHSSATLVLIATLIVSIAGCDNSKTSATNSVASAANSGTASAAGLQIKPLPSMSHTINVPMENERIEIYRCDFVAHNIRSLKLKLVAVRDGEVLDLGEVEVPARGSPNRGSMYVAYVPRSGDESGISRLLACGIAAKSASRATPIGKFSFEGYSFKRLQRPAESIRLSPDKDAIIWAVHYQKPIENEQPKTLQEVVSDEGPFANANLNPEKVIENARTMKDSIVVIAIGTGVD